MIDKELERIAEELRSKGQMDAYVRNALKEYLQVYVLYFIYTSSEYKQNLIFTGGTCLRHFFGLERLSEDVDFDYIDPLDTKILLKGLSDHLTTKYQYANFSTSLKQNGQQILLKFPVLKKLGLANEGESDLLYIKIDLSPIPSKNYATLTTAKSSFGLNYAARHYDLPSLMAGKLHAILTRRHQKGSENRNTIKGRDYFDLLWFIKEGVQPNIQRLSDMLSQPMTLRELEVLVDEKVDQFMKKHRGDFESDISPLIQDSNILESYVGHYQGEYLRFKGQSFSQTINLNVVCQQCQQKFSAGIAMDKDSFAGLELRNVHACPFCHHKNHVDKKDYLTN